jgi:hypothetical protein
MSNIDYDINNYSIPELFAIIDLDEQSSDQQILDATNMYISKYTLEGNKQLLTLFTDIQTKLLHEVDADTDAETDAETDAVEDKNTLPKPPQRTEISSANNFSIPVKQDKLNPNIENITTRVIHLDSQFRQSSASNSATDYTLDLSDPLTNVLNLRLYSIQIPYTWYTIDSTQNNNFFWITNSSNNINYKIMIDSGNYTPALFVDALNKAYVLTTSSPVATTYFTYNQINGKITIDLSGSALCDSANYFTFFDFTNALPTSPHVNNTLGWAMGFRDASLNIIESGGNTATCILDLYGTKNLILIVDDYNQNHINSSLIGITETSKVLSLPNYYRPDLPYMIIPPDVEIHNDLTDFGDSTNITYRNIPSMVPTRPRILTQSQIYTINEIMKNREKTVSYRTKPPSSPDILAMIPMKHNGMKIGDVYVEFGSSLQINKRIYFGPVNIERLRIKLLDDKGNVLNLNGIDWSVTLISENLYQY